MDAISFNNYSMAIEAIEAHEQLLSITSSTFPHLKKNRRTDVFNDLKNKSKIIMTPNEGKVAKFGDVKDKIMRSIRSG